MFSVVIPVYNEAASLEQLWTELSQVANERNYAMEAIFVDDGSQDGSWDVIESLAAADDRIQGIRFRRNFGKAAALNAGFAAACGDVIVTLDADLQDDPREIPRFLEQIDQGVDVVSGWKKLRHDPWHKVLPSRVFNWLVSRLTGVHLHDHNCGFKCYRREIFDEVTLYGELHRFVPVLADARGWSVGELVVQHRARQHGKSKYGLGRIPKGLLDLFTVKFLTGYNQRPQHLLGSIGLLAFGVGGMGLLYLTEEWFRTRWMYDDPARHLHLHARALFYYTLTILLLGAQFLSIGFLAELFTASHGDRRLNYSVSATTGRKQQTSNGHKHQVELSSQHSQDPETQADRN